MLGEEPDDFPPPEGQDRQGQPGHGQQSDADGGAGEFQPTQADHQPGNVCHGQEPQDARQHDAPVRQRLEDEHGQGQGHHENQLHRQQPG